MRTRWRQGGSALDDLSFWCGAAVLFVYFGGVRDYAAQRAEDDDPVWGLLLRPVCRGDDCGELGDVPDQTLGFDSKFNSRLVREVRPGAGGFAICGSGLLDPGGCCLPSLRVGCDHFFPFWETESCCGLKHGLLLRF